MQFTINSEVLKQQLAYVSLAVSSKSTGALMECILFEVNQSSSSVRMTGCDEELRIMTSTNIKDMSDVTEGSNQFALACKDVKKALANLKEQDITFDVNEVSVTIKYNNGKIQLPKTDHDRYPAARVFDKDLPVYTIDSRHLLEGINRTLFAAASDELRPILCGIHVEVVEDTWTFVGTNGHKLIKYQMSDQTKTEKEALWNISARITNILRQILMKEDCAVKMSSDASHAVIKMCDTYVFCRLTPGNYPNFNGVIPTDNEIKVVVDKAKIIGAIKRVSVCADNHKKLRLNIATDKIGLICEDIDFSNSASETISCSYDGNEFSIGFDGSALLDILNHISDEEVVFLFSEPTKAALLNPKDNADNEEMVALMMPMMIS